MMIQTTSARSETFSRLGRYFFAELTSGKHSIALSASAGEVRVIVTSNASHRAWRGLGKAFGSYAEAIANYKTPEVRAMLEEAQRLDAADAQAKEAA